MTEKETNLVTEMPLMELYGYLSVLGLEELSEVEKKMQELIGCLEVFAVAHLHAYREEKKDDSLGLYIHCTANTLFLREKIDLVNDFKFKFKAENEEPYLISLA